MNEKLNNHINMLFADAPKTRRAFDLKEELLANLIERYNDLIKNGVSEEDAYKNAVDNIGDVDELISNLKESEVLNSTPTEEDRKKHALVLTVCVALYFLAFFIPLTVIELFSYTNRWGIDESAFGSLMMLAIAAIPTCILIYHHASRPKYHKSDDTIVEEFKEWSSYSNSYKSIRGAVSGILWTLTVFLYLLISFMTMRWYITWMIFLFSACLECIITLIFKLKEPRK